MRTESGQTPILREVSSSPQGRTARPAHLPPHIADVRTPAAYPEGLVSVMEVAVLGSRLHGVDDQLASGIEAQHDEFEEPAPSDRTPVAAAVRGCRPPGRWL